MRTNGSGLRIINSTEEYWAVDVEAAEEAVSQFVTVPLNHNQFSALVSFVVTIGLAAFKRSQVLRCINESVTDQRNIHKAAELLLEWTGSGTRSSTYLKKRRKRERQLFLTLALIKPEQKD